MRKAFVSRLYPTQDQAREMQRQLDVARELYNACLEERRACYRTMSKSLTYYDQANQLKATSQICLCGEQVPKTLKDRWHDHPTSELSLPRDPLSAMLIKRLGHRRQPGT